MASINLETFFRKKLNKATFDLLTRTLESIDLNKIPKEVDIRHNVFFKKRSFAYTFNQIVLSAKIFRENYSKDRDFPTNVFLDIANYLSEPDTIELCNKTYKLVFSKKPIIHEIKLIYIFFVMQYYYISLFVFIHYFNSKHYLKYNLIEDFKKRVDYNRIEIELKDLIKKELKNKKGFSKQDPYAESLTFFNVRMFYHQELTSKKSSYYTLFNNKVINDINLKDLYTVNLMLAKIYENKKQKEEWNKLIKNGLKNNVLSEEGFKEEIGEENFLLIIMGIITTSAVLIFILIPFIRFLISQGKKIYIDLGRFLEENSEYLSVNIEILENKLKETTDKKEQAKLKKIIANQEKWNNRLTKKYEKILAANNDYKIIKEQSIDQINNSNNYKEIPEENENPTIMF